MNCRPPESFPSAEVTWYRDGRPLVEREATGDDFALRIEASGDLMWNNVQLSDAGSYICIARNSYANNATRASRAATLTVLGWNFFTVNR
jgi:hypothetical protein